MAFRPRWRSEHVHYEQSYSPADTREVTVRRVVNICERRTHHPAQGTHYDGGYEDDSWFEEDPNYLGEECPIDNNYLPKRYYDENPDFGGYQRNSPQPFQEPHYQRPHYDRNDLRHQIRSRKNGRPGPYFNNRGRGHSQGREDHNHFRPSQNVKGDWDRSSGKKKIHSPAKKNASSVESEKIPTQPPKTKPVAVPTPSPSVPAEESPETSSLVKEEKPLDSVPVEEPSPSSVEPEPTQDDELKARRSEAIKAKALEIEKHYRQDCETFVTVVKMLVSKEPTLENLLHSALNKNLSEIKQHCFSALRHYVKELDEALECPDNTT